MGITSGHLPLHNLIPNVVESTALKTLELKKFSSSLMHPMDSKNAEAMYFNLRPCLAGVRLFFEQPDNNPLIHPINFCLPGFSWTEIDVVTLVCVSLVILLPSVFLFFLN